MSDGPINKLPNIRKAAVIIASLGTELASQVCSHLDEALVRAIADEVARLDAINAEEYSAVLREFSASCLQTEQIGGIDMAQEILNNTLGTSHGSDLLMRDGDGLERLRQMADMEPHLIARRLEVELPQTAAVLLSQLAAAKAAAVVQNMPEKRRGEILARTATLQPLAPGALQALATGLEEMFVPENSQSHNNPDNTFSFLLDIMTNSDRQTQQSLLDDLRERAPELAARIEQSLFTFEDLLKLPDRTLQTVLRAVETQTLALALKGLDEQSKARVTENLSERATQALEEDLEALGPVRVSDVENARAQLAAQARALEEAGDITIDYEDVTYIE